MDQKYDNDQNTTNNLYDIENKLSYNMQESSSSNIFLTSYQINEFIDIIYEICIYSKKKDIRDYYIGYIIENVRNKLSNLLNNIKNINIINEQINILSHIKMFSRIMLFLFFVKKKYIILYEQCLYNNLHFLYEHHFYPSFFNQEKGEHISINQDIIKQKIFFYEHIFLNIHNVYFYLFQKKKKKRTFSLKIFWRAYHNFKMKFNKEQFINEEENMSKEVEERNNYDINYTSKDGINIFHNNNNNVRNDNDIGVTKKKDKRQNYTNIFKYSSDWNYNTNVLNIYITDFLNKECIYDEKILMDILSKVCIHSKNEDGSLQLFNYIIIYILRNCTTFHIYHDEEKKKKLRKLPSSYL